MGHLLVVSMAMVRMAVPAVQAGQACHRMGTLHLVKVSHLAHSLHTSRCALEALVVLDKALRSNSSHQLGHEELNKLDRSSQDNSAKSPNRKSQWRMRRRLLTTLHNKHQQLPRSRMSSRNRLLQFRNKDHGRQQTQSRHPHRHLLVHHRLLRLRRQSQQRLRRRHVASFQRFPR